MARTRPEVLIRTHMEKIRRYPNVISMADAVNYSQFNSKAIAQVENSGATERLEEMLIQLPATFRINWIRHCNYNFACSNVLDFSAWFYRHDADPPTVQYVVDKVHIGAKSVIPGDPTCGPFAAATAVDFENGLDANRPS